MTEPRPHTESHPSEAELVEFVRSIDARAPDSLHRQVESLLAARPPLARRRSVGSFAGGLGGRWSGGRSRLLAAGSIAAAAAAVAVVVSMGGGGSALNIREASALALREPTAQAPAESASHSAELAASVDGISFPYWEEHFGWRARGARTDRVGGRTVTTVFYADNRGRQVGYAIVAGLPAPRASGGVTAWRDGTAYALRTENGAQVVSWLRGGHLCVVSGRGVSGAALLRLASWGDRGSAA